MKSAKDAISDLADSFFAQLKEADKAVAEAQVRRQEIMAVYNQLIQKLQDADY